MTSVELKKLFPEKKVNNDNFHKRMEAFSKTYLASFYTKLCVFLWYQIKEVKEMSLSANQERTEMEKKRLVWKVEESSFGNGHVSRGGPVDPKELTVELAPMEIRTFIISFDYDHLF